MAADTAAFVTAFSSSGVQAVYVPTGTCQIDNSRGAIRINGFTGCLNGDGYGSSITFSTLANDGFDFNNPTNFTMANLQFSFAPTRTARGGGYPVNIQNGTNLSLGHLWIHNGNLSALRIGGSIHVILRDIHVSNFLANGIYTVNNVDLQGASLSCSNDGDACFEASYYDSQHQPCNNISIDGLTSNNDVSGVLINSCSDVTIKHFTIDNAAHEGVWIGQDSNTTTTQWPDNITLINGAIRNSGFGMNALNTIAAAGIILNISSPTHTKSRVSLAQISITNTMGSGVQLADDDTIDLTVDNLALDSNGVGNGAPAIYLDGNQVTLSNTCIANSAKTPLYIKFTKTFVGTNVGVLANSVLGGVDSFSVVNYAGGSISLNGNALRRGATATAGMKGAAMDAAVTASCVSPQWMWEVGVPPY